MSQKTPKRLTVVGIPGSGKSTFALKLGRALNIPVYHLDRYMFEAGGKKREREEFLSIQRGMVSKKSWVIEGCAISTLEVRVIETDILIYFHFSPTLCIWWLLKRVLTRDKALSDTGCANTINWRLLRYIWTFNKKKDGEVINLKNKYPKVKFYTFRNPQDVTKFLNKMHLNKCI